jgi:hypothetical protein
MSGLRGECDDDAGDETGEFGRGDYRIAISG